MVQHLQQPLLLLLLLLLLGARSVWGQIPDMNCNDGDGETTINAYDGIVERTDAGLPYAEITILPPLTLTLDDTTVSYTHLTLPTILRV